MGVEYAGVANKNLLWPQNIMFAPSSRTWMGVAYAGVANENLLWLQNIRFAPSSRAMKQSNQKIVNLFKMQQEQ